MHTCPKCLFYGLLFVFVKGPQCGSVWSDILQKTSSCRLCRRHFNRHLYSIRQRVSVQIAFGDRPLWSPPMYISISVRSLLGVCTPLSRCPLSPSQSLSGVCGICPKLFQGEPFKSPRHPKHQPFGGKGEISLFRFNYFFFQIRLFQSKVWYFEIGPIWVNFFKTRDFKT